MIKLLNKILDINIKTGIPTHLKVTITSWISIGIRTITNFLAIKFILPYLGVDGYAVYVILFSFISWVMLTDFGVGQSLQNYISEFRVKKQDYQPYINTTLQIIIVYAIVAIVIFALLYVPIQNFILGKYILILNSQTVNVVLTTFILFITIAVTNVASKVYYALQKGTIPNMLTSISYIVSFCAMLCVVKIQSDNNKLLKIILCYTLPQIFLMGGLFFEVFKNSLEKVFQINVCILKQLLSRSVLFGGIAIMVLMVNEIDYFIMAKTLNSVDIAVYSVFAKISISVYILYLYALSAFWPTNAELYHSNNFGEIKNYLKKYLIFGIILMSLTISLSFAFKKIIFSFLLHDIDYNLSYIFFVLLIIYFIARIICDTCAIFLQGFNILKIFFLYQPIQVVICIFAQYFLSIKYGINGIILGLFLCYMLTVTWILPCKIYKILKK